MDTNTLQALTALASKLGTSAELLWGVLLAQAPLHAALCVFEAVVCVIVTVAWCMFANYKTTERERRLGGRNVYMQADWTGEGVLVAWAVSVVASLYTLFTVFYAISQVMTAIMNPGYWALMQILNKVN